MLTFQGGAQRFCDGINRRSFLQIGAFGAGIPPFVSLRGMSFGNEPGYLGVAHRAFTPDGPGLRNLALAGGVSAERTDARRSLLSQFDDARREADGTGTMRGMDAFTTRA